MQGAKNQAQQCIKSKEKKKNISEYSCQRIKLDNVSDNVLISDLHKNESVNCNVTTVSSRKPHQATKASLITPNLKTKETTKHNYFPSQLFKQGKIQSHSLSSSNKCHRWSFHVFRTSEFTIFVKQVIPSSKWTVIAASRGSARWHIYLNNTASRRRDSSKFHNYLHI